MKKRKKRETDRQKKMKKKQVNEKIGKLQNLFIKVILCLLV